MDSKDIGLLSFPLPEDLDLLFPVFVVENQVALVGALQGIANPSGDVDACGGNNGFILFRSYTHDAFKGVFALLQLLDITDQIHHLLFVLPEERASDHYSAGRVIIGFSHAGRTGRSGQPLNPRLPGPPAALVNR